MKPKKNKKQHEPGINKGINKQTKKKEKINRKHKHR